LVCVDFDEEGWCYTGGENGIIQVWGLEATVSRSVKIHSGSQVTAIHAEGKKLISASKDFKVAIISIGAGGVFKLDQMIDLTKTTAI